MSSTALHRTLTERLPFVSVSPPSPLGPARVLRESLPIAGILLLWTMLSWVAFTPFVARAIRATGVAAALAYVVVRGVRLGEEATPLVTGDAASVLGQQLRLVPAPAAWFLAGVCVPVLADLWDLLGLVGLFTSPADDLVRVCALAGVGTALLVVVAGAAAAFDRTS
jgi:hypothetical protein